MIAAPVTPPPTVTAEGNPHQPHISLSLSLSHTHTCICNFVYVLLCLNSHVGFIHLYLISLHVNLNFAPLLCISLTDTKAHTFMCLCM